MADTAISRSIRTDEAGRCAGRTCARTLWRYRSYRESCGPHFILHRRPAAILPGDHRAHRVNGARLGITALAAAQATTDVQVLLDTASGHRYRTSTPPPGASGGRRAKFRRSEAPAAGG